MQSASPSRSDSNQGSTPLHRQRVFNTPIPCTSAFKLLQAYLAVEFFD